jgi:putative flippase GtrA
MTKGIVAANIGQMLRYGMVGALTNFLGYLIYLLITALWLDPKVAVTLMYPIGALIGYAGHARYSFAYSGRNSYGFLRYVIAHLIGYGVNIGLLYFFSDRLGYAHQLVQAVAIVVVAGVLYVLFRYFVFPKLPRPG